MPIDRAAIRKDVLNKPCPRCDELVDEDDDAYLTFTAGQFVVVHDECWHAYSLFACKGPRGEFTDDERERAEADGWL